jgi:carbonic anhydrase/acetyltransferase-like protein (isoleucine patch superfamily)
MMRKFKDWLPRVDPEAYIDGTAVVIGDVEIGPDSSVWPNAVIRGDRTSISIGRTTSVQDNVTVHSTKGHPVKIGDFVTVGHNCVLHGARVRDGCLIGMGAIIMNGVELGESCLVGAGAVLTESKKFPPRSIIIGIPGKVVGEVTDEKAEWMREKAENYATLAKEY